MRRGHPLLRPVVAALAAASLLATPAAHAGHGDAHATIKYWDLGALSWWDPHETVEDIQGVTGHVATPSAPLTLVTSMENTGGGWCGPLYWNPVTNTFKTYQVTFGLQTAGDVNREAPALANGSATFQPGDSWFTVHGSGTHGIYMNFRNSDGFRRYGDISGSFAGIRLNQATGVVYGAAFEDGAIFELDPATNAVRSWTIGNRPYWLDVDAAGRVYTAASAAGGFGDQIVRVDPATNEVRRWDVPGGGFQTFVSFGMANGVRLDADGDLWFSQTTIDTVSRLRVGANAIDQYAKAGLTDPNGIAASGAGASLQAFFTERAAGHISLLTAAAASPVTTPVAPAVSTVPPAATTSSPVDFTVAPLVEVIPPVTFDSPGVDPSGIIRFPAPPGTAGPAGISRVAEPSTIYGSFEGSDHVFRLESPAIIAPPGSCPDGPTISVSMDRPLAGRIYVSDADVGPSGSSATLVLGTPLTTQATSSNPANTSQVDFFLDGGLVGSDAAAPYALAVPTGALSAGAHTLMVRAKQLDDPACLAAATLPFLVPAPAVKAVAKGFTAVTNVPAEPQAHSGGAAVGATGGSDFIRVVDQPLATAGVAHGITDQAQGSNGSPFFAEADSTMTDVSLLGGVIEADVLRAHARADFSYSTLAATASGAGSHIAGLEINGTPLEISQPNTVVSVPGVGRVVLQETLVSVSGVRAEVTVNMIHAFVDTPSLKGEITLGSAYAGVNFEQALFTGPETDLIHRADDAGTDTDAGATAAGAVPLAPGLWSGSHTPGDDSDFYSFDAGQGDRILAEIKPAEREVVTVGPQPQLPTTVPGAMAYPFQVLGSISAVGPTTPNADVYLYDPTGALRAYGESTLSLPDRVEINADLPYAPAGAKGTWTLEVRRETGSPDAFYSLHLAIAPVALREQNDAEQPGDAGDTCAAPRPLPPTALNPAETDPYAFAGVIRDTDTADAYQFDARIGQLLDVVLKPDELDDGADFDLYLYGPAFPGGPVSCASPIASSTLGKPILPKGTPDFLLGLPVPVTGTYVFVVTRYNAVANYYVNVTLANPLPTIPSNDAGTGSDASDTCASATPLGTGGYEGRLGDVPAVDTEDWYAVTLGAGQDLTAVMKPSETSNFDLELYTPACVPAPSDQLTLNHQILSVPEMVHVKDGAAGVWRLRVRRVSGGGNYALALAVNP